MYINNNDRVFKLYLVFIIIMLLIIIIIILVLNFVKMEIFCDCNSDINNIEGKKTHHICPVFCVSDHVHFPAFQNGKASMHIQILTSLLVSGDPFF